MENHNPNSHTSHSWSELPLDLLISVFKRLSFANFGRAKSVCSSWWSASRQSSLPNNQIPWLILFPEDNNNDNHNSCTLFNPEEEEDKLYKTKDLGLEFAKSFWIASYGSWLLMRDPRYHHLYIVNLFSNERISLPTFKSLLETPKIKPKIKQDLKDWLNISNEHTVDNFIKCIPIRSPVFWIDEKTKDYIVLWGLDRYCIVYAKKGDTSWNQIPETSPCRYDMVYKDHKLYFLSNIGNFKIFDFSQEIPQQSFQDDKVLYRSTAPSRPRPFRSNRAKLEATNRFLSSWSTLETKLVVTVTGDVLKVERILDDSSRIVSFRVGKIYSSSRLLNKYEQVDSLGDESMILDLGITMDANQVEGLKRNCIYFSRINYPDSNDIEIFNLETRKMERLHKLFNFTRRQLFSARWFLPTFTQT